MTNCPMCGLGTLHEMQGEFHFQPPPNIPGGEMIIPNSKWLACDNCKEELLPGELNMALEKLAEERTK